MVDYTTPATVIYNSLFKNNKNIEERDALALIALSLRSFYEQGFESGRNHERYGTREYIEWTAESTRTSKI
ncbi:MAG: hypothetical protein FJ161_02770 [Gammaproteobacteria bacterium]|nr:hypothetical protein [Gammaproteobacteria bacterium]